MVECSRADAAGTARTVLAVPLFTTRLIGASLSEPHTSVTALRTHVSMVENLFTQVGVRKSRVATNYVRVSILTRSCS